MDMIALAMAKSYSDSKGGYVEENVVEVYNYDDFTIDGKAEEVDAYCNILGRTFTDQSWAKHNCRVTVVWDGVKYECRGFEYDDGTIVIGNQDPFAYLPMSANPPFSFEGGNTFTVVYAKEPGVHTFTVSAVEEIVHPIDPKYLPANCEVVTVNLAECEVEPAETLPVTNYNMAILALFSNGGGSCTFFDLSDFWETVSSDKTVRFVIDASSMAPGLTIEAEAKSCVKHSGKLNAIETSFLVQYNGWYRVTAMFLNNFNSTTDITVYVEPLTIP